MLQKKICLLGAFAVGKTSLVKRFVTGLFSEKYHTTIGVKIDKKTVTVDGREITFVLWDLHGEDEFQNVRASYLRGGAGYLLVVDGTRRDTLNMAQSLHTRAVEAMGAVPFVLVINKSDLADQWEITDSMITDIATQLACPVIRGSAKTGDGVEEAFSTLAKALITKE